MMICSTRQGEMGVTAGIVEFADLNNASQEGPPLVRLTALSDIDRSTELTVHLRGGSRN